MKNFTEILEAKTLSSDEVFKGMIKSKEWKKAAEALAKVITTNYGGVDKDIPGVVKMLADNVKDKFK